MRETEEEIGIKIKSFRKAAVLKFFFEGEDHADWNQKVHVFLADEWDGEPSESEEMMPKWCENGKLPFTEMWPDDAIWLEKALSGKKLMASFLFGANDQVTDYRIEETESL